MSGFLFINDVSGSGSGAIASYRVDTFGRIASIEIVDLERITTLIQLS